MEDTLLSAVAPKLAQELARGLSDAGHPDLAAQVPLLGFRNWSYDPDVDALTIQLFPPDELNVVEENIIGQRYGGSVSLPLSGNVAVDLDNFGAASVQRKFSGVRISSRRSGRMRSNRTVGSDTLRQGAAQCCWISCTVRPLAATCRSPSR
jgi:hypothetical protein